MKTSFAVVCYNSEKYIKKCLDSILEQSISDYEIFVIDNASSDSTLKIINDLIQHNNSITLIQNPSNLGYGKAIQKIIPHCSGDYVAILNADSYLDKDWTKNLIEKFSIDSKLMCMSGKVMSLDNSVQSTGGIMDRYCAVIQRDSSQIKDISLNQKKIFYNDGSAFMVRKKIFEKLNFDPNLFLYYEDVDFCWKLQLLGYKIDVTLDSISYHDLGHSNPTVSLLKFFHITKNRIYLCQKNFSLQKSLTRLPVILFLAFLGSIYYEKKSKKKGFLKMYFKALFWNIKNYNLMKKEQSKIRHLRKTSFQDIDNCLENSSIELRLFRH